MAARVAVGDPAARRVAKPLPVGQQMEPARHDSVLQAAMEAAAASGVRGKAVTPFLLDYMQRATGGASVAVNLDVAHGNVSLAGEIATAWAELSRG
jgi:pseudouridine-5'-phosphate glycosidase